MRQIIYIVILFLPLLLNAQTSGIIVEQTSKTPVEGAVIQYGNSQQEYALSDKDGKFIIPEKHNSIIHIHSMGYKRHSILSSDLLNKPIIELAFSPIMLNEVEINYFDANRFLEKAFSNTINSLLTNQKLTYFMHFVQSCNNGENKHELELHYSSFLKKNKLRIEKIPYELNLIHLSHLYKDTGVIDRNLVSCEYHVSEIFNSKRLKKYRTVLYSSENDSIYILKTIHKSDGENNSLGSNTYHINKKDTTICLIDVNYTDFSLSNANIIEI